jgi:hypothetical protein
VGVETARRLGGGWTADSVRDSVDVKPVGNTNVLAITARRADPALAERLATAFAKSALGVRWRTIAGELDDRIAALTARPGDRGSELRALDAVRRGGTDPTLKLEGTSPAVAADELSGAVVVVLALLGGLFLGALAALGIGRLGRRVHREDDVLTVYPLPVLARVSPAGVEAFRTLAVQIERWAPSGGTIAVASPSTGDGRGTAAANIAAGIAEGAHTATVVQLDAAGAQPVHELLAEARALADFVVVDGPPLSGDARALRAATLADIVVLVVRLGHTGRQELRRVRDVLEHTGIRPAGLLLVEAREGRVGDHAPPAGGAEARPPVPPDVVSLRR